MKNITILLIISFSLMTISVHGKEVNNCNADVSIPEQGVTVKLRQGVKKHRLVDVTFNNMAFLLTSNYLGG